MKPLSKSKTVAYRALMILLPLLALSVAEALLRACGYGGHTPCISRITELEDGALFVTNPSGAASYFFASRHRPGSMNSYAFISPKPPDTYRVILAGGSAVKGFPQPSGFSDSAFLQLMLQDLLPNKTVEVINLGTTAVASFPVMDMLNEMWAHAPDLVIVYAGHNEFFGAYGVASQHKAGRFPTLLPWQKRLYSTALAQAIVTKRPKRKLSKDTTLMEGIIGRSYVAPEAPLRHAAARNLYRHLSRMVAAARAHQVPILLCTLPSNERDLAPLGSFKNQPGVAEHNLKAFEHSVQTATRLLNENPEAALAYLAEAETTFPKQARLCFLKGSALFASGQYEAARAAFQQAIDYDPMPWRAPSASLAAIRQAAQLPGAHLCDIQRAFQMSSPGGCIGWELMDDHVHPSLEGQALMARSMVRSLTHERFGLTITQANVDTLPPWTHYAQELGDNPYDRYGVAHTLRVLCNISFYRSTNPEAYQRFDEQAKKLFSSFSPILQAEATNWQKPDMHKGAVRPLSGIAAHQLMREPGADYTQAKNLFRTARNNVPEYSAWALEYLYFELVCRQKIQGCLREEDLAMAQAGITRGRIQLQAGASTSGHTERYTGRLLQMCGRPAEAIPLLLEARNHLYEMDRVAVDYALISAYVDTQQPAAARALAEDGATRSGRYASLYREMLNNIPAP